MVSRFSERNAEEFLKVGFTVIDNAFPVDFCMKLKSEIDSLYKSGLLYLNKTYLEGKMENKFTYSNAVAKPNIYELDLVSIIKKDKEAPLPLATEEKAYAVESRCAIPHLRALYREPALLDLWNEHLPTLGLDWMDLKVQYNKGEGACFPMHFDTTPAVSRRQVTCILYLNAGWSAASGGELRVFPFPYQPVDIAPVLGRLVMFSSHQLLHRVLPSQLPRYCVTLWLDGSNFGQLFPGTFPWVEGIPWVMNRENRKIIARLVHGGEWEESILASFKEEDTEQMVKSHQEQLVAIRKKLGDKLVEFLSENLPLAHEHNFIEHCSLLRSGK
uniref:Fe2OG dioxygenase domain-containing protein n=1 Tax=Arcella intermedia TaxID=1963864 RepID=A0A6B2L9B7_9EUKA